MKKKFSEDEVLKIARLSALDLSEDELKNFVNQFSEILDYFELLDKAKISKSDTDMVEKNILSGREDKVFKSTVTPEHFSPYLLDRFFRIPKVIDKDR
tara:strand:- start:921 stop:1214 length:294 start_codon:yes stop_codon:yes gene_type:complete